MQGAKGNDAQVHAEIEDAEYLGFGKGEHENATVSEGDARENLGS